MNDGTDVQAFGGQQREAVFQVVPHHAAEYGAGTGSGTVALVDAGIQYFLQKLEVLSFHVLACRLRCNERDCIAIGDPAVWRFLQLRFYGRFGWPVPVVPDSVWPVASISSSLASAALASG